MGLGSFLGKAVKSLNPGAALFDLATGAISGIAANKGAKADAANQTAQFKYQRDRDQGDLTRRAKKLAVLLRMMEQGAQAKPGRYGGLDLRSAYGAIPGLDTGYEAADFALPQAPTFRGGGSGLLAGLGGAIAGAGRYVADRDRAQTAADARADSAAMQILGAGQPAYPTDSNGVTLLPTRRLLR